MRTYSDILRDQATEPQRGDARIASNEPPDLARDPELRAAREKLTKRMCGTAWADSSPAQRIGFVLWCIFAWVFLAPVAGFGAGVVFFFVIALADLDHPMTGAKCDFVIRGGFYLGLLIATVFVAWAVVSKEREIRRVRSLSHADFLRTFRQWDDQRRAREAAAARLAELDYQAERTAYWTEHYRQRDGA